MPNNKRDFDVLSLDLETSGAGKPFSVLAPNGQPYALLSIGCVRLSDFSTFYAEVGYPALYVSPEGMKVNGIDLTKMLKEDGKTPALPTISEVDEQFLAWLKEDPMYKTGNKFSLIPLGFNIGSFDMQFIHYWMPKSSTVFGYRSMDLNALLFDHAIQRGEKFKDVKAAAKTLGHTFAIDHFKERKPHHALYDAWLNIGAYHYIHGVEPTTIGAVEWEGGRPAQA